MFSVCINKYIKQNDPFLIFFVFSIPEDVTRTSVILDGATYQRLFQCARSRSEEIREHQIEIKWIHREYLPENLKIDFHLERTRSLKETNSTV